MTTGDKIAKLRRENNYTQEQLADILSVSRQAISKWESNGAFPETEKLIKMSELFGCTVDYLLKENAEREVSPEAAPNSREDFSVNDGVSLIIRRPRLIERRSSKTLFGLPLWHIGKNAKGIIAIGLKATGVIAIGCWARGVFAIGCLAMGLFSLGSLSLGLIASGFISMGILSAGCFSAGMISAGAISLGVVSVGAVALGDFTAGGFALGKYFAAGGAARGMIAIGENSATGELFSHIGRLSKADIENVRSLLDANVPVYLEWAKNIIKLFLI